MRQFQVPFDLSTEDKIIGGYLSFRQFFWFMLPGIALIFLFMNTSGYINKTNEGLNVDIISITWRILIIIVLTILAATMSLLKIKGLNADKYYMKKILYKIRPKIYIYRRYRRDA